MKHTKACVDQDGCISCGNCENICPQVFELVDGISTVKADADYSNEEDVRAAADSCPVAVISVEE